MFEVLVVLSKSSGKWETSDQRGQAFITMCLMVQISFVTFVPLSAGTEMSNKEGKKKLKT